MRNRLACVVTLAALLGVVLAWSGRNTIEAGKGQGPMLCHDVYFTLNDNSPESKKKLVAACKRYLSKHAGEVFFAAGTLAEDLKRPVNDLDFDVALHIVFQSKADQDKYQDAPRHLQFIAENKDSWKKVRVFDSVVER
jgi:hypothetical protein